MAKNIFRTVLFRLFQRALCRTRAAEIVLPALMDLANWVLALGNQTPTTLFILALFVVLAVEAIAAVNFVLFRRTHYSD